MLSKLKPKSEFSKNVLTLMTGTTIAQAIPIAISPILTRIYTPEDFGVFALYMSITTIISVVASGRYEVAIMLPKEDEDALHILVLAIFIALFITFVVFLSVLLFGSSIAEILGNQKILPWLYFIPFSILLTSMYQSFNYWHNREKRYKKLAINRVVKAASISISNLFIGFLKPFSGGLILSSITGQFISTILLAKGLFKKQKLKEITLKKTLYLAKKYKKFPLFDTFAIFANVSSQQMLSILFTNFFISAVAGYFYLTQKILGLPITLLASSVTDVFRQSATKEYHQKGNAKEIFMTTLKKLFFLSLIPTVFIYFYVVDIFRFVFGDEWGVSGEYAKVLLPMFFLRFIVSPLTFMIYLADKQKINLLGNLALLLMIFLSFYLASDVMETIKLINFSYCLIYVFYFYISFKVAQGFYYDKKFA